MNTYGNYHNDHSQPWIETSLSEETIDYLWSMIEIEVENAQMVQHMLAGQISKSRYISDKDNWFYETTLKKLTEKIFYQDWNNYYKYIVEKEESLPEFKMEGFWVNYQKQYEFNPPHDHSGLYSFVVFMKIPTHWKEQHALPISINSNNPCASDFQFLHDFYGSGKIITTNYSLSPEDEGNILFFPAWLKHQVFPFYECEEDRITISGNIIINVPNNKRKKREELRKEYDAKIILEDGIWKKI